MLILANKKVILKKLSRELMSGIDTEAKTLYLLAEIRKILDFDKNKKMITLNIFCNWALHSELSYPKTTAYFKQKFERYIDNNIDSKEVGKKMISSQLDFFKLTELKTELCDFLKQNNLQHKFIRNSNCWIKFRELLLEILKECPIKINGNKIDRLSVDEDSAGISYYRFHLKNKLQDNRNVIKIKLKIK